MKPVAAVLIAISLIPACRAQEPMKTITIKDPSHDMAVTIWPSLGNNAGVFTIHGQNVFWVPPDWPAPVLAGNPLLAPWANRFDQDAFYANGKKYLLNPELRNVRRDPSGHPIHGLLAFSPYWQVVAQKPNEVTSRLEYWRHPDLMAQFPFAHTIEMTYRLAGGMLEIRTRVEDHSAEPMPMAFGYHPYFRLTDAPRDDWKVHLAAREHVVLSKELVPTGERKPVAFPDPVRLRDVPLDDVFTGLVRDERGRAVFSVEGRKQKLSVIYGPKYTVAIVYAPPGRDFICFEPMSALTNGFNLAHAGLYPDLQYVAPGAVWEESYWVKPEAF